MVRTIAFAGLLVALLSVTSSSTAIAQDRNASTLRSLAETNTTADNSEPSYIAGKVFPYGDATDLSLDEVVEARDSVTSDDSPVDSPVEEEAVDYDMLFAQSPDASDDGDQPTDAKDFVDDGSDNDEPIDYDTVFAELIRSADEEPEASVEDEELPDEPDAPADGTPIDYEALFPELIRSIGEDEELTESTVEDSTES